MIRNLLLTTALVTMAGSALAADLPARGAPAPYAAAPVFTWTGAYVGAAVGYGWLNADFHDVDDNFDNQMMNGHREGGVFGGLYAGYNWQVGSAVFGLEAAGNWHNNTKITVLPYGDLDYGFLRSELNWTASVKARAGVAFGNSLVYVAAGPSFADLKGASNYYDTLGSSSDNRVGVALAAGVEHAITPNFLLRLQGEYTAFERKDWRDSDDYRWGQTNSVGTVSVGIAYKFN